MRKLLGYKYLEELNIYNFNIFNFGKVLSKVSQCHSCHSKKNIIENCKKDYKNFYK